MRMFQYKIQSNDKFREVVKQQFKKDIKETYLPDQTYINLLIASLFKVEANSYSQSHDGFMSEYIYLKEAGMMKPIKVFIDGCLNQLLWVNTILESVELANTEEELEEKFDYSTPSIPGNPWTLDKVTKKGVYFRGDDMYKDSRVIINSENIIEITKSLSTVTQRYSDYIAGGEGKQIKKVELSSLKEKESSLFKSLELQTKCLNVLKDINPPVLDVNGNFINKYGMKGAIVIWHYHCEVNGYINKNIFSSRNTLAKAVMDLIPDLSIDGSSFGRLPIAKKYKEDIEEKLAQFSSK